MSETVETSGEYLSPHDKIADTDAKNELAAIHQMLAELDSAREHIAKDIDNVDKIYYSRLPVALFHATTQERAMQIAQDGLKPSKLQFEKKAAVSLSDTVKYAKFCASVTQNVNPSELVVLEITTQGLDRENMESYLLLDNPHDSTEKLHEVHSLVPISPDWVHQLSDDEIHAIEAEE